MNTAEIVRLLEEASDAYYNGGTLKMDDDTYDSLVERLKELDPTNAFLEEIGAPVQGSVALPYPMPSLDKIKPGEDSLKRFLQTKTDFVISEKLDGLSALWVAKKKELYLRGDGIKGQVISHLVPLGLKGLMSCTEAVRGEIILPRSEEIPLKRSWVNGQVHQKTPLVENISKIHFIAYEVMNTSMTRSQQFKWLQEKGFETPWYCKVAETTEENLSKELCIRRAVSLYDTDGLVVGIDRAPVSQSTATKAKNPKDCVAFKMSLADQSAETTVRGVIWASSAQGYMIPRLQFDPVVIGSAKIEFCTAHNARTVLQHNLGPGAKIIVRRSGDVIPKFDGVILSTMASFPPAGTWVWDENQVHIKVVGEPKEVVTAKLQNFLKTLEIPGAGPATAMALVDAGIQTPSKLWLASAEKLSTTLGPKTGAALYANLRTTMAAVTESTLMIASSAMPRGVKTTKLANLFAVEADPRKWHGLAAPDGWTAESFKNFLEELSNYVAWREREISWIPFPIISVEKRPTGGQVICLTSFRDKELEKRAEERGHTVAATMSGKVTILLVPDGELKESEKVKTARAKNIKILSRSQFLEQYLS